MELIIEEKANQPISYEGILKNMNLKVVDDCANNYSRAIFGGDKK